VWARSYSTYEGLKLKINYINIPVFGWVHILPMRDWNPWVVTVHASVHPGSYSTYEGLKLQMSGEKKTIPICSYSTYEGLKQKMTHLLKCLSTRFIFYLWGIETLCTAAIGYITIAAFIFYLWGIETPWTKDWYTDWSFVHILPMRDWNVGWTVDQFFLKSVHILPMRDWNEIQAGDYVAIGTGSYSTYEGLKHKSKEYFI